MSRPGIATQLGFYGVLYLLFVLVVVVGYGPAQEYARPLTSVLFPAYAGNSMVKTLVITTLFYWGAVGVAMLVQNQKK